MGCASRTVNYTMGVEGEEGTRAKRGGQVAGKEQTLGAHLILLSYFCHTLKVLGTNTF